MRTTPVARLSGNGDRYGWLRLVAAAVVTAGGLAITATPQDAARNGREAAKGREMIPPREVKVLPCFFVPKGEAAPTDAEGARLIRYLEWARTRYREMLGGRDTFAVATKTPRVFRADETLADYRARGPDEFFDRVASELLRRLNQTRYNCPYVLLVVIMNSRDDYPTGRAGAINGGYNTGGGLVLLSSFNLNRIPYFESTLEHELGHAFGLPHVDVYSYDMQTHPSLMSYDPRHHTNGFNQSPTPGRLMPEDIRGLALNRRAFSKLRFDPAKDVPAGYTIFPRVVPRPPVTIPDQPSGVRVTTSSGEDFGSKVVNVVGHEIRPNHKTDQVTYDPKTMWQSAASKSGWVAIEVAFPYAVELTRIAVHSQHSGQYNAARAIRVAVRGDGGDFRPVTSADLKTADDSVTLPKTRGQSWRLEFQAGESNSVTLRGLQFFAGDDEVFPPPLPYQP
jgi:hypothetical protein